MHALSSVTATNTRDNIELRSNETVSEWAGDVVATVFSNLLGLAFILWAVNFFGLLENKTATIVLPIAMLAGCIWSAYRLIRRRPITLLTTYPWILLVIGAFHGFGSLAPVLANPDTQAYISGSFVVTPERLARTNSLNFVGLAAICVGVLVGHALGDGSKQSGRRQIIRPVEPAAAARMAKIALAIGLPVMFLLRLPAQFGWLPFVLPGSILQLASFVHVAFIILAYLYEKRWPGAGLALGFLVPLVLLGETITFSKEATLLVVVMPFIGSFLAVRKISRLAYGAICCGIVYAILIPVVAEGRRLISNRERAVVGEFGVPMEERIAILKGAVESKWFNRSVVTVAQSRTQIWWSRLSYNNVQAFAMNQYDQGRPGNSLRYSLATLVPRILWPNKPITALQGVEFQKLFTGRWNDNRTSVGIGAFGESYWVAGWWGAVLIPFAIGLQLAIMSNLVFKHERRGDVMAYIFCFLYGIITARAIDKWIVMSYIGNIPIYIALYVISMFAARYTSKRVAAARQRVA